MKFGEIYCSVIEINEIPEGPLYAISVNRFITIAKKWADKLDLKYDFDFASTASLAAKVQWAFGILLLASYNQLLLTSIQKETDEEIKPRLQNMLKQLPQNVSDFVVFGRRVETTYLAINNSFHAELDTIGMAHHGLTAVCDMMKKLFVF